MCALVFDPTAFAAGVSYFGVADVEALALDTHKFESRYLDSMIGPYPERADLYRARSPVHFVEQLERPHARCSRASTTRSCRRRRPR